MNDQPEFERYPFTVEPGSPEDGEGFFVSFPDLPGCLADGETYEEAIANARDAFTVWMIANQEEGGVIPQPGQSNHPVKYVQRLPQSLHKRVTRAAELDGVSMNTLVSILIAEGLARREARTECVVPQQFSTLPTWPSYESSQHVDVLFRQFHPVSEVGTVMYGVLSPVGGAKTIEASAASASFAGAQGWPSLSAPEPSRKRARQ